MQAEALLAIQVLRDPASGTTRSGVCLFDAGWHQGVVGLVASRVKERLRRPVIAFAQRRRAHAARLGALGGRRAHARCARCGRDPLARTDSEVRRSRDGRRASRSSSPGSMSSHAPSTPNARAGSRCTARPTSSRPTVSSRAPSSCWPRPRRCVPAGPGGRAFPSRCSMASFAFNRLAWWRAAPEARARGARGAGRVRRHFVQLCREWRAASHPAMALQHSSVSARVLAYPTGPLGWSIGSTAMSTWASGGCSW